MKRSHLLLFLKGLAMGAANVVPGVSGGTIAYITGIFEELIESIKRFNLDALKLLFQFKIKQLWEHVNGTFLLVLFAGVGVSIVSLAKLFKFLLEHPDPSYGMWLMAFFFGLILVSIFQVGSTIQQWNAGTITALIIGLAIAVGIALVRPASENDAFWYVFLSGAIAICSMILPGLSGSFVLILLGNYKLIMLDAISSFDFRIILPFAIGAIIGLAGFAYILSWIIKHYREITIALMTGFIAGSLSIIWPWKHAVYMLDAAGNPLMRKGKPIVEGYEWYMPGLGETSTWVGVGMIVIGALLVWGLDRWGKKMGGSI
ncbi:MAG: DUF368 domain-containing protein [Bacteroidia bacterium]